jgi:site-specific DNA recombinase
MNEEGKKIKLAWQWKLSYEKDVEIQRRLQTMGVIISTQDLSKMWRKTFYCGVNVHSLLDEPVMGSWEPMVTEKEFLLVQEIISGRKSGYKIDNNSLQRPLTLFLRCNICGEKMSSYQVKKKRLHYYKCQWCNGSTINADTLKYSRGRGAHEMFSGVLTYFQLNEGLMESFKSQILYTYHSFHQDNGKEQKLLHRELDGLNEELKTLRRNHAFGKVDKLLFEEFKAEQEGKILAITEKLSKMERKISNLDKYVNIAVDVACNLHKYWCLQSIEVKRRIQNIVFPQGLYLDAVNRIYLTPKTNSVFEISCSVSGNKEKKEGDSFNYFIEKSPSVAWERFELSTSGL